MILGPLYAILWGWKTGGLHVMSGTVLAWLLLEARFVGLEKLAFTCSYVPGRANLKSWWGTYAFAYLAYVAACSWLNLKILEAPVRMIWFLVFAAAARVTIGHLRKQAYLFDWKLEFDDAPEPAVRTLDIA